MFVWTDDCMMCTKFNAILMSTLKGDIVQSFSGLSKILHRSGGYKWARPQSHRKTAKRNFKCIFQIYWGMTRNVKKAEPVSVFGLPLPLLFALDDYFARILDSHICLVWIICSAVLNKHYILLKHTLLPLVCKPDIVAFGQISELASIGLIVLEEDTKHCMKTD